MPFKGCQQMRPNSTFLQDLNNNIQQLKTTNPLSIWTPYDQMIIPQKSAIMAIGKSQRIALFPHRNMVSNKKVTDVIGQHLLAS